MQASQGSFPIASALKQSLQEGYDLSRFKSDIIAGLIVSLVALPLAMALAVAVGLPPQHGIYTAIVAGIIVPLLGGSKFQVSGPTAAFVVIVAPIVQEHGLRGLIITTILAGFFLIVLGVAKLGRYINYVPYPVTTGFTSGIAVVIGTLALNDFLGLHIEALQGDYLEKVELILHHIPTFYWPEALVGAASLAVIVGMGAFFPKMPAPVVGVLAGTVLAYGLQHYGFDIATIGNRFSYMLPDGSTGQGIPPFPPTFHVPGLEEGLFAAPSLVELRILFVPALVIAALGALESLLSAAVADGMAGTKHQPNAELVGIGVGNILSGLAAGIPATGAIARTATNIHSGAKTPIASVLHALLIMAYVMLLAPAISYIPMAALAALLISVAYRMSHWRQFKRTIEIAPRSDTLVLLACFGFTVFIDMVAGVTMGVVLACFLLMKRVSGLTYAQISHKQEGQHQKLHHLNLPDEVMVYHINGLVFFGTVENALERIGAVRNDIRTLVIDMENVPLIDMTGLVAMKNMIMDMQKSGREIVLCGNEEVVRRLLHKLPIETRQKVMTADTVEAALRQMENEASVPTA